MLRSFTFAFTAAWLLVGCAMCASAQVKNGGIQAPPSYPSNGQTSAKFPGDVSPEEDPLHEYSRARAREKERQKRIVDDASRLVKLTAQYRTAVEQHGSVTPDDEKLLMQIEKLAREVKDRMRGM